MDVHVPTVHGERLMDLEEISSEITSGSSQVMAGALRMARALEHARVRGCFDWVRGQHGIEKSQAYNLSKAWRHYGDRVLDGTLSSRLETLSPTHLIAAMRADDPIEALDEAADENLSVKQMESRMKQRGEEVYGVAEVVETTVVCPKCGGSGEILID
jgi:hypothetical protein